MNIMYVHLYKTIELIRTTQERLSANCASKDRLSNWKSLCIDIPWSPHFSNLFANRIILLFIYFFIIFRIAIRFVIIEVQLWFVFIIRQFEKWLLSIFDFDNFLVIFCFSLCKERIVNLRDSSLGGFFIKTCLKKLNQYYWLKGKEVLMFLSKNYVF